MQITGSHVHPRRKRNFSLLRSIGSRLFFSVLGGSLVGLGCTSYLFYQALAKQAQAELRSSLEVKAEKLEGSFNNFENSTKLVADAAITLYQSGERREQVYVDLIRRSLKTLPLATGLGFGQPPEKPLIIPSQKYAYPFAIRQKDGTIVAKGGGSNPDDFKESYFRDPIAAGKDIWLEPVRYEETTVTPPKIFVSTSYSLPFYNNKKELLGVLGQDLELGFLSENLSTSVMREHGHFVLVSAKGNLIAYPPNPDLALNLKPFTQISNYGQLWEQVQKQLSKSNNSGILSWKDSEGNQEFWAYRRITNNNWVLLASIPKSVVIGPLLQFTLVGTLLAALGASILLAIVVAMFVKRLNQRLQPIMDECNLLAENNAKSEELMSREDEIGRLTISFYNLLGQVTVNEKRLRQEMARSAKAYQALQKTQAQLIQTEKMSGLGQLVAGVAHEINNPINFIYANLPHASIYTQDLLKLVNIYQQKYPHPEPEIDAVKEEIELDFLVEDLEKILTSMRIGADRIREIVLSLRNFSRFDEAEMKYVNIHEGIDSTLLILQSRLKATSAYPAIEVIKEYGDLPLVECYAGQLNQVFMNILCNSIDALNKTYQESSPNLANKAKNDISSTIASGNLAYPKDEVSGIFTIEKPVDSRDSLGTITIHSEVLEDKSRVIIRIRDDGPGILPEHQPKLFDPFFTTKPVGKGTGLGLSISYQIIVDKHQGILKCISEPGKGAEFWIEIPVVQGTVS